MNTDPDRPGSADEFCGFDDSAGGDVRTAERPAPVEAQGALIAVRRNLLLSYAVGALAVLIGFAYLLRNSGSLDGLLGLVLLAVAAVQLLAGISARMPVLVADEQGIRLRVGLSWRGLPWGSIRQVVVEHPDGLFREGRLVVVPRDPDAILDRAGALGEIHLRWNQFWYGAPLAIPLGLTTVIDSPDLAGDLGTLADGRSDVVNLRGRDLARLEEVPQRTHRVPVIDPVLGQPIPEEDGFFEVAVPAQGTFGLDFDPAVRVQARSEDATVVENDEDEAEAPEPEEPELRLPDPVAPLREVRQPARVEVRLDPPARDAEVSVPEQRLPGQLIDRGVGDVASWEELPVDVVIDDLAASTPVADPVIGPKIAHAREMLDMSIEELSQRTRIRPHVLEAIEVDDFGPCGGDFYARGHLTAIARVLGLTLDPLMRTYDERYAHGPINARRVFEADLSTGLSGGMRATLGGPRWSLLIGSVLCLAMVWGLARLFAGAPEQITAAPDPSSQVAGLAANRQPITSPLMKLTPMTLDSRYAGAHVVVRDRTGRVLWSGALPMGHQRKVLGLAPFKVSADNAGAVVVTVRGKELGTIGTAGSPGAKKFG